MMLGMINTPARVSRIESFSISFSLAPVHSVHRLVVKMSDSISVDILDWLDFFVSIEERFESGERHGFLDMITDEIQTALLMGKIFFADEEDDFNVELRCADNIVVSCNLEEKCLDFYELQAD